MRYVIMADGKMSRWEKSYEVPKHLLPIDNEILLGRTVRQIRENDPAAEVIITSHDPRYGHYGAVRYEPKNNVYEIDRFTEELIVDDVCFMYGDTYYTDGAVAQICRIKTDSMYFVGTSRSIVAVIAHDGELMRRHVHRVREMHMAGQLKDCRGWQLYQSFTGQSFDKISIGPYFLTLDDGTQGFNRIEEYQQFIESRQKK